MLFVMLYPCIHIICICFHLIRVAYVSYLLNVVHGGKYYVFFLFQKTKAKCTNFKFADKQLMDFCLIVPVYKFRHETQGEGGGGEMIKGFPFKVFFVASVMVQVTTESLFFNPVLDEMTEMR